MATATFNNTVIAESDDTVIVEGNHYFPIDSIKREHFSDTDLHTMCGWKGQASYYAIEVDGERADNAAWYYPEPMDGAEQVAGRIAFYASKVDVDA